MMFIEVPGLDMDHALYLVRVSLIKVLPSPAEQTAEMHQESSAADRMHIVKQEPPRDCLDESRFQ